MSLAAKICPQCGDFVVGTSSPWLCPRCLLGQAIHPRAKDREGTELARETAIQGPVPAEPRFGDYELIEEIARGGMGVVYRARQRSLNRIVAVKLLLFGYLSNVGFIRRFRAEAEAAASLRHPNIVSIHEVGEHEGQHFFSMDYIEGTDLATRVREGPLPPRAAAGYLRVVAEAIHYSHQRGILHRDLKPSNILIDLRDVAHVTDFGLAQRWGNPEISVPQDPPPEPSVSGSLGAQNPSLTSTGQIVGTLHYMPPEQVQGARDEISPRSDIYAMGAILYHLLTGRPPFLSQNLQAALNQIQRSEPVPPHQLDSSIPLDLESISLKCLQKDPIRRYATAQELADELQRFLLGEPIRARPVSSGEMMWRWCRRHPWPAGMAFAIVFFFLSASVVLSVLNRRLANSRAAERTERERTEQVNRRLEETVIRLEMRQAENLRASGHADHALASLARVLREHPTNALVAERVVSALLHGNFALPVGPPMTHSNAVTWVAFSPDGRRILSASRDHTAKIWPASGASPPHILSHQDRVLGARFSPDGVQVATGSADHTARLWDAETGAPRSPPLEHSAEVLCVEFSPDGRRLATGSADRHVRIWDATDGRLVSILPECPDEVRFVQYGPSGQKLVSGGGPNAALLWDLRENPPTHRLLAHSAPVNVARFHPGGQVVVTASEDRNAQLWQVGNGEKVGETMRHRDVVLWADFSPDGDRLVTGSRDTTARVWNARTGRPITDPLGHQASVNFAKFSADGRRVVTASSDNSARIWDSQSGVLVVPPIRQTEQMVCADFSPLGDRVVVGGYSAGFQVWDVRPGRVLPPSRWFPAGVEDAEFSGDASMVAAAVRNGHMAALTAWNLADLTSLPSGESRLNPFRPPLTDRPVVAGAPLWTRSSASNAGTVRAKIEDFWRARFSPNGMRVITFALSAHARVWDVATGRETTPALEHADRIYGVSFSPEGERVATASADGSSKIWNLSAGNDCLVSLRHEPGDQVLSVEFSPDGNQILTGGTDNTARLWDARSGTELARYMHPRSVISASFSPDGTLVVTGCLDRTARVWSARTGEPMSEPMPHEDLVWSARFSPDGHRILTTAGAGDRTARVWDALSGLPLGEPFLHMDSVVSGRWSPDGRQIVTASEEGAVRVWETPGAIGADPEQLADLAEAVSGLGSAGGKSLMPLSWARFSAIRDRTLKETIRAVGLTAPAMAEDSFGRLARWLFADRATRTISPFSKVTVAEHLESLIRQDVVPALREAVEWAPADPAIRARLAELETTRPAEPDRVPR